MLFAFKIGVLVETNALLDQCLNVRLTQNGAVRNCWRITVCYEKSKFAISSGWHKKGSVSHLDDKIWLPLFIRVRYQPQLSHPDDIRWTGMSSGWHNGFAVTHQDEIPTPAKSPGWHDSSTINHLDEIRPGANSSGWLRVQMTLLGFI